METIEKLQITFQRMNKGTSYDIMEYLIEVLVADERFPNGAIKYGHTHLFQPEHFRTMWEQLMERATLEIGAAVKEKRING